MLTNVHFYWLVASVATKRLWPISDLEPSLQTNENMCFADLIKQNIEFVALSGC
jgi:hypothetical protein